MKIHHLPQGARFEYEGEEYVKTGPMLAIGKGGQRLIPKYAVLKPIGEMESGAETPTRDSLARAEVLKAFDAFCADCQALLPAERLPGLQVARERFLQSIG
jgi:hypothetical protein